MVEAEWLGVELARRGIGAALGNGWDPTVAAHLTRERDLAVALGGDGTILHVARIAARSGTPVLGVNLGRVGFLAELTPKTLHECVDALAANEFWIEQRMMLDVEWQADGLEERFLSLNEVSVGRGGSARAVRVVTLLDGQEFVTFTADAVLVATPTGSTAYSLAAGGAILYPEATDLMITPVAPHLHIGRSIIVPGSTRVTLSLPSDRSAVMSVDGAVERTLKPQHSVHVRRSDIVARFARFSSCGYFYSAIRDRLK
ncbi:MAG TPA: NAD(+)/NADH kinase [Candidatus Sulfotelmatobacter sp.]|nr:NAD(+)/NADH kinase [Candidatus Sulfotelmatobacter sp.]